MSLLNFFNRNATTLIKKRHVFPTVSTGQTQVEIKVYPDKRERERDTREQQTFWTVYFDENSLDPCGV